MGKAGIESAKNRTQSTEHRVKNDLFIALNASIAQLALELEGGNG
jgi:hypothetical protein